LFLRRLELFEVRNVREASLALGSGLNVLLGKNAQGKTSILEGVGLLARGRSFRSEHATAAIRRGSPRLLARASTATAAGREIALELELSEKARAFRVDGRDVPPREYHGRLEVVVYATERLKVVRGAMRERRLFLDRGAAALWPSYRQLLRDFERVLAQRNAALASRARDLPVWSERFCELGAALRQRRADFARRLTDGLERGFRPAGERYAVAMTPAATSGPDAREELKSRLEQGRSAELAAGRPLHGPHRDTVSLLVNGEEAAATASAGQARSLLLALALATLQIYREEQGEAAVALLDDLDSELDEDRTEALCREIAARGQALVTTAHPGWAARLRPEARLFHVEAGEVRAA
jgi:DNA replication and repair protein RecF